MRIYDFSKSYEHLLKPDIVALLTSIHEYKGEQALFIEAKADVLTKLVDIAKVQSTEASNKIAVSYTHLLTAENKKKGAPFKGAPYLCSSQD